MVRSYKVEAIVLKRSDFGETDRIVTLFTRELGKMVVLAKGVRKPASHRAASIEVGTRLEAFIIKSRAMDILTQTIILDSYGAVKQDLTGCTQLYQLLEVVDILTREYQELPEIFDILADTLESLGTYSNRKQLLLSRFKAITEILGFTPPDEISEIALKNYIESIAERKLHSKDFLIP